MPVFTEGKGVPFPRWQLEEDPSLMLMQIDAPTDAEHPDVQRYAHMLSEALFKQGRREPNWWKYPRGTRRFNKIYGTKFSSAVPSGAVTGIPRRTAQSRRSHATKREGAGPLADRRYTAKQRAAQAEIKLDAIPGSEWSRSRVIAILDELDTEALREIERRHYLGAGIFTAGRQVAQWAREVLDARGA